MSTPKDTERVERELTRSLHDRVDHLAETPLTLADVRGRARGITRRRRLATAAGVAAAAAIAVPAVMLAVLPGSDRADIAPAAPSPTTQVTPDDARAGGRGLDLAGLPTGSAPAVGYLDLTDDPTVVTPGGRRVVLDVPGDVHGYATMSDGSLAVVAGGDGGDRIEMVDPEGESISTHARSGGVALSPDRSQLAYAAPDGVVAVLTPGRGTGRELGVLPRGSSVVSLAGGDCFEEVLPGGSGGCMVTADVPREDGSTVGWVLSTTGADDPVHRGSGPEDPAISSVADYTTLGEPMSEEYGEMVAGITEVRVDGTCSGVYGPTPQRVTDWLVETCEHRFGTFSPDAARILAWEAYGDGLGHTQIGVYDVASGERLWDRVAGEQGMAFVHSATWEDDSHLLAMAYQDGAWHLVRFGPDGSMELAAEPVDGDETQPPYVPEIQP